MKDRPHGLVREVVQDLLRIRRYRGKILLVKRDRELSPIDRCCETLSSFVMWVRRLSYYVESPYAAAPYFMAIGSVLDASL